MVIGANETMPTCVTDIVAACDAGQTYYSTWRKTPTQVTGNGIWFDISMSPGNPIPNYYAASPLIALALSRSTDGGLDHGGPVAPLTKYIQRFLAIATAAAATPLPGILLDYLMYYPFVDMGVIGQQNLTTNISLPRYPTGAGVQVMAVEVASQAGGSTFNFSYTNSSGVSGRTSQTVTCNTQTVNGTIITSAPNTLGCNGPFIPLQAGDTGVQSIQSVNFITGDVGLITLVLVKPLVSFAVFDITAPVEREYIIDSDICVAIKDDAYLNFICHPTGSLAAVPITGELQVFWS